MKEPRTPAEWQEAVDGAAGLRALEDCAMYGLITGGPHINLDRCDEILKRGAEQGIRPSRPVVEIAIELMRLFNAREPS